MLGDLFAQENDDVTDWPGSQQGRGGRKVQRMDFLINSRIKTVFMHFIYLLGNFIVTHSIRFPSHRQHDPLSALWAWRTSKTLALCL